MTQLLNRTHKPIVLITLLAFCCTVLAQQPGQDPNVYQSDEIIRISTDLALIDFTVLARPFEVDVMGAVVSEKGAIVSTLQQHLVSPSSPAVEGGRLLYTMQFPNLVSGIYQVWLATRSSQQGLTGDVRQGIEIPDTSKGQFLLGTVLLSEVRAATAQKAVVNPDLRFARTSRMRFQGQIYNAEHSSKQPELTLEMQLTKDGQVVIATPPAAISIQGVTNYARIPFIGEFPSNGFSPGQYDLKLTITDLLTKATASGRRSFTVQ